MFCTEIKSTEDAQKAYKSVQRFKIATMSTHLISAYKTSDNKQGWQDDGDHGMGRHLYNSMKDIGLNNAIIFLARDFGGIHLGQRRFQIIVEMVKEIRKVIRRDQKLEKAINSNSSNSYVRNKVKTSSIMVSEVEGEPEEQLDQEFPFKGPKMHIEEVKAWDANRVITRHRTGDREIRKDYFNNPEGWVKEGDEFEDVLSEDGDLEQFGMKHNVTTNVHADSVVQNDLGN